jgi:hypothetical protein
VLTPCRSCSSPGPHRLTDHQDGDACKSEQKQMLSHMLPPWCTTTLMCCRQRCRCTPLCLQPWCAWLVRCSLSVINMHTLDCVHRQKVTCGIRLQHRLVYRAAVAYHTLLWVSCPSDASIQCRRTLYVSSTFDQTIQLVCNPMMTKVARPC